MSNKPILANKPLIGLALTFYGNKFVKKEIKLSYDKSVLANLEPPYIVVANHSNFVDVGGLIKILYPQCANFVISETQKVQWPMLINYMGILPKKQFTVDMSLLTNIRYCLEKKRPVVIYPEAKLSVVGVPNIIKPSVAKLVKMFKVPLVTVCFNGSYLHHPRWASSKRFVPVEADIKVAVTAEEAKTISANEVYSRMLKNLTYDDYAYQLKNHIDIDVPDLVNGLEHILYKCPNCDTEFQMTGYGNTLKCEHCGKKIMQSHYGMLVGGEFQRVPDWYQWETKCVCNELRSGTYFFDEPFMAEKLIKKKYWELGEARIVHNAEGITAIIKDGETLHYPAGMFYTLSFNNDYVYLPTNEAVYRFRRLGNVGCTTKLNIGIEQQTILLEQSGKLHTPDIVKE